MSKETVLKILLSLENYRIAIEKGEIETDNVFIDNEIRLQQADLAERYFEDRKEWIKILKEEYGLIY